jgi:uncharacterized membrane protein YfcA
MSASVGVGGGGVYVPLFIVVACLDTKGAIPVSKICILGVAVTTFLINMRKRHPKANRPLINYSVAFLMAPTTILGTVFGIMLFIVFPQWFILILLVLVLGVTDYRTIVKALELHRKEEAEKKKERETIGVINDDGGAGGIGGIAGGGGLVDDHQDDSDERSSLLRGYEDSTESATANIGGATSSLAAHHHRNGNYDDEDASANHGTSDSKAVLMEVESSTPIHKIMGLVFLWLAMLLLVFIRGGGESASEESPFGIFKCSWQFWLLTVGIICVLCTGAGLGVWMQIRRTKKLREVGIPTVSGDIEWTPLKFVGFVLIGCFAGTCAGFLGIGSGMINVPYMLEVGMQPEVAAATSSFIIVFTALSTVVQYIIGNLLPLKSAAWYGTLGLLSAIVGQFAIGALVRKYKKASIISFLLAGLITFSAIGLVTMGAIRMSYAIKHHTPNYWSFHNYCAVVNSDKSSPSHTTDYLRYGQALRWEL